MFRKAVELESSWGAYITQGQILGFTDAIIKQYIQYLADRRLEAVGYKPEYNVKHPIPWVDGYASFNDKELISLKGICELFKGSIDFDRFLIVLFKSQGWKIFFTQSHTEMYAPAKKILHLNKITIKNKKRI